MSDGKEEESASYQKDYRLKQLEFLLKFMESEVVGFSRITQLLIIGNAAAIGVVLILLKDLKNTFADDILIRSLLAFVFGVMFAGLSQATILVAIGQIKSRILDLLINSDPIDPIREVIRRGGGKSNMVMFASTTTMSIVCFLFGALQIIFQKGGNF